MSNGKSGFTLIEILVVVLIISILSTVVGVSVSRMPGKARMAGAKAQIGTFKIALQEYQMELGSPPTEQQGLAALCNVPTASPIPPNYPQGGYIESITVPRDPWDNDYAYFAPARAGKSFEIVCYGRDGQPGGVGEDADISSLEM
jgi:general secretion pathway protein G